LNAWKRKIPTEKPGTQMGSKKATLERKGKYAVTSLTGEGRKPLMRGRKHGKWGKPARVAQNLKMTGQQGGTF